MFLLCLLGYSGHRCIARVSLQYTCVSLMIQMCVESTGNGIRTGRTGDKGNGEYGIGTGRTGDTGHEVYKEPEDGERSDNRDSQGCLNMEIIASEMPAFDDDEGYDVCSYQNKKDRPDIFSARKPWFSGVNFANVMTSPIPGRSQRSGHITYSKLDE